jgi:hypothetical protein
MFLDFLFPSTKEYSVSIKSEEIEFVINRNDKGEISGFSLTAQPEHYAEAYCLSFPSALSTGKGSMKIEDGNIVFDHQGIDVSDKLGVFGVSAGGKFTAKIPSEDLEVMTELITRTGRFANTKFGFRYEQAWSRGFTVYRKED